MLLSIIIPIYNTDQYLASCLESILNQSFDDFELLLIDDGSTDSSGLICDQYEQKEKLSSSSGSSRIRVFHKEHGGVCSARNLGLDHARGEYIHFVDSDDMVLKGAYQYCVEQCLSLYPDLVFFCNLNNATQNQHFIAGEESYYGSIHEYVKAQYVRVPLWRKIFKRDYLIKSGVRFNENLIYGEDTEFLWSLLRTEGCLVHSTSRLYSYSTTNNSAERNRNLYHVKRTIDSLIITNLHLKEYLVFYKDSDLVKHNFTHKYEVLFNRILCTPYSYSELPPLFAQCAEIGTSHLACRGSIRGYDFLYHHPLFYYLFQYFIRILYFRRHKISSNSGCFLDGLILKK